MIGLYRCWWSLRIWTAAAVFLLVAGIQAISGALLTLGEAISPAPRKSTDAHRREVETKARLRL